MSLLTILIRISVLFFKFIFTLFIAKYLGFHEVGLYGLLVGAGTLIPVLVGLGINYSFIREAVSSSPEQIVIWVVRYVWFLTPFYLLMVLGAAVLAFFTERYVFWGVVVPLLLVEHLHVDAYQLLLNRSKAISANLILFIRSAAWMLIYMPLAFYVPYFRDVESLLFFWLLGGCFGLAALVVTLRNWPWRISDNWRDTRDWIFSAIRSAKLPYLNSLGTTSALYIDRYLITVFLGLELAGVYIFFWTIYSALFNLVYTGIVQFYRPRLVIACKSAGSTYISMYRQCMMKTLLVSLVMSTIAGVAVSLLVPYIDRPLVIEWLPVLWVVLAVVVVSLLREVQVLVFYSLHEDALLFKSIMVMLAVALSLNLLLIPMLGLWGAALAFLAVNMTMLGLQGFLARPLLRRYEKEGG